MRMQHNFTAPYVMRATVDMNVQPNKGKLENKT